MMDIGPYAYQAWRRRLHIRLVLAIATPCLLACGGPDAEHEEPSAAAVTARTIVVDTSTFIEVAEGSGLVAARIGHAAALSAAAPTRVVRVHVAAGDEVPAGAPLVDFDVMPFDVAVTSAQAALAAAEQASARATRLVAAGIAPRKDAELAAAELAAAQAAATNARRARELATLRAPFAGVVTRMTAVLGSNVDAGQVLVEVVDPSHIDVLLQFPPSVAARLHVGQPALFREGAAEGAAAVGSGRIADVSAIVDSLTRAVSVRVTIDTRTRPIRVGESVFGTVTTGKHAGVTVIPEQALVPSDEGFRVFVVDSANVAHARQVSVGGRAADRVWVTEGLKPGERLVTAGAYGMDDGVTVISADSTPKAKP